MSERNFCESGKHIYRDVDVLKSMLHADREPFILTSCEKCDSKFLKGFSLP